ncbi:hypothetical protein CcaCcLH18_04702 [Colletotrichum camelliae]|nr:hypothetical protein CcaCcLH18_04702 [Colletotrichum camelliae]
MSDLSQWRHAMDMPEYDPGDSLTLIDIKSPFSACVICQRQRTTRKCALCNVVLICSMNCQQVAVLDDVDSKHFATCVSTTDTAKTFYKNVLSNRIPSDAATVNDYQFYWLCTLPDYRKLLKMYAAIIGVMDVTPRELDLWVKEEKLFERIAMLFHCSPNLISLEDVMWLKGTDLWREGLSETARAIFQDVIARKQEKLQ